MSTTTPIKRGTRARRKTSKAAKTAATPSVAGQTRARKSTGASVRVQDVARYARVSTASVSRAFNMPELVSDELRARVNRAAQLLNWVPNGAAKALASSRSRMVGALIPTLGHQNFATLIEAMQRELQRENYTLIVACTEASDEARIQQVRRLIERGVECLIIVGESHPPGIFELLRRQRVPYLITYALPRDASHPCVGFDNYAASARVTQHLLDLGHRRFALIAARSASNDRIQQRVAAVKDTLAKAGLGIRPQHYAEVESSRHIESGRAGLRQVWTPGERPTAVICTNDYLATGAMIEAKARRIAIPKTLSIAGFDDVDMSAHLDPPLTTVRVPVEALGLEIARYVERLLHGDEAPARTSVEVDLVVRGSTAPPPAD